MKKALEIAKQAFKAQLSFRFDILASALITLSKILFAMIVWGAIFGTRETVSGFTLQGMITYYIISAILAQLDMSDGIGGEVAGRIRDGTFSKYMVVPVGVFRHFLWQTLGTAAIYLLFNLLAVLLWVFVFGLEFAVAASPAIWGLAALMVALGLVFMAQLNFFIGLLAFKFLDVGTFLMIKENIVAFITGTIVPLALLPAGLVSAMRVFPFYYVTYLPSMLLIGRNEAEAAPGVLILLGWVLLLCVVNTVAYRVLRKRYEGVGI